MDETPESQEEVLDELLEETLDESLEKAMASEDFLKIPKEFFGTGPLLMPVIFEAKDALQISNRDGISHWTATITAYRDQKPERVFENVGFITAGPQAHIEGIQLELNDPLWANHELARSQREFITYLHDEPRRKIERNGFMTRIFKARSSAPKQRQQPVSWRCVMASRKLHLATTTTVTSSITRSLTERNSLSRSVVARLSIA